MGSWYDFDQIIEFFNIFLLKYPNTSLIILTQSDIRQELLNLNDNNKDKIIFISAKREFIPEIIGASDLTLCFIKKLPSKIFSSPTKVGESLGCGVPIVFSEGVGDLDDDIESNNLGFRLNTNGYVDDDDIGNIILSSKYKLNVRENSMKKYSLKNAIKKYNNIYTNL